MEQAARIGIQAFDLSRRLANLRRLAPFIGRAAGDVLNGSTLGALLLLGDHPRGAAGADLSGPGLVPRFRPQSWSLGTIIAVLCFFAELILDTVPAVAGNAAAVPYLSQPHLA